MTDMPSTLKTLRLSSGVPQSKIAQAAGISTTQYQNYEYGKSEPTASVLLALADFFGVSTDYLLGRTQSELIIPPELEDVEVAFHRGEFEGLSQDEVDKLAEYAKFVKSQRNSASS